ncbi:unnamed protein product [Ceratitis capitata]|uniref:(Mediterranean fruit fly) hypothetical protein n=1 Tax=Ceratitis capitata TaxID=7213 RepID=A0A811V861_CERCA|nr:unnamed protein product [Ceratitis capitata]
MFSGMKRATRLEAQNTKRNRRIIEEFVKSVDVPNWYRGLSSFQISAAYQLHYAIRDDLEQGTTDRVMHLINHLGLRPSISKQNIQFMMFLSGGNDLAFLWFIKELFYKSDGQDYNLNEQLILSSIAHLDTLYTLRGLDSILPPEQPTKEEIRRMARQKIAKQKLQFQATEIEERTVNSVKVHYKLPYFDELVRPRPYHNCLTAYPPTYQTKMIFEDVLRDPNHVIPNANNRWFADYQLHPGKKTGVEMLNEKMDAIFESKFPRQSLMLQNVFNKHFLNVLEPKFSNDDDKMKRNLCLHHKTLAEMEIRIEHELRMRARDKCMKYFDAETPKKEERIARIRQQIEKDVNERVKQFKRLADRTRSHLDLWSKSYDDMGTCSSIETIDGDNKNCDRLSGGLQHTSRWSASTCRSQSYLTQNDYTSGYQSLAETTRRQRSPRNVSKVQRAREILHRTPCDCGYNYVKKYDYGHSEKAPYEAEEYFRAPDTNRPYMFDYPKVFDNRDPRKEHSRMNVQKTFLKVINSDLNLDKNDPKAPQNLDEAVKEYAKKIFKEGVIEKNIELAEQEELEKNRRRYAFLDVEMDYYDPDDRKLMQGMLKNALDHLAKDPKYVLASMPDAHKLPSLLAWMETRYGKTYTREQLRNVHIASAPTFHALKQMTVDVMMPSAKNLGDAIFVNYNCRDYLMKKTEKLRNDYYKKVNDSIMAQSRAFYLAIKPYVGNHPRHTFFAYMPSREADIQHFRIWRPHEHMPAKDEFFKRKCRAIRLANRFY